jgi:signal transduction histidine kinase
MLVIYYVEFSLTMPDSVRIHFRESAIVVVLLSCTLTVLIALWETPALRKALRAFRLGESPNSTTLSNAAREAVIFPARHARMEAWFVPCSTLLPELIYLKLVADAPFEVLTNITLTVFMGISMALMSTFFAVEYAMQPVIRFLLDKGATLDYDALPKGRVRFRWGLCSTLIIMTTALMISLLAWQRAADIMSSDVNHRNDAVRALMVHSVWITVAAVITGVVYSQVLGNSVAYRVANLVGAMENVARGSLSERLLAMGNDELDRLARQFNTMVQKLATNHDTIQDLNANLEDKVRKRTQELQEAMQVLQNTQSQLTDVARRAGMAEVATGVLHNVGNVLNSVNISTHRLNDLLRKSRLNQLQQMSTQLKRQRGNAEAYLGEKGRAEKLLEYICTISEKMDDERTEIRDELQALVEKVDHIKGIVATQQNYARPVRFRESVDLAELVSEILSMHSPFADSRNVQILKQYDAHPVAFVEKSNVVQVVENLVKNAIEAMSSPDCQTRVLRLEVAETDDERALIRVTDTGCGIAPENLKAIFNYGFTTKQDGKGFGLHSSALAVSSMGGSIRAQSDGPGQGVTFEVELPLAAPDDEASEDSTLAASAGAVAVGENCEIG